MKCPDIRGKINLYYEGSLTASNKKEIDRHLKDCMDCRSSYDLEKLIFQTGKETAPVVPAGLSGRIMARVEEQKESIIKEEVKRSLQFMWLRGATLALFIAVALSFIAYNSFRSPYADTSLVEGSVEVESTSSSEAKVIRKVHKAEKKSFRLAEGDTVRLKKDCQIVIYPSGMGSITASENTILTPYALPSDNLLPGNDLHIKLHRGTLYATVEHIGDKGSFLIETGLADVTVKGTVFEVKMPDSDNINVKVYNGIVNLDFNNYSEFRDSDFAKRAHALHKLASQPDSRIHHRDLAFLTRINSMMKEGIDVKEGHQVSFKRSTLDRLNVLLDRIADNFSTGNPVLESRDTRILTSMAPAKSTVDKKASGRSFLGISWTLLLPDDVWTRPIRVKGRFFAADKAGNMILFDKDGNVLKKGQLPSGVFGGPVYGDRMIAVPTTKNGLVFVDPENLVEISRLTVQPVVGSDILYTNDKKAFCIATTTGEVIFSTYEKELWRKKVSSGIYTSPVFKDNKIFVVSQNGIATAFDINNGVKIWQTALNFRVRKKQPVLRGDNVYFAGHNGDIKVLNINTGEIKYSVFNNSKNESYLVNTDKETFIVYKSGRITIAAQKNTEKTWDYSDQDISFSGQPVCIKSYLMLPSGNKVLVVDSESGEIINHIQTKDTISAMYRDGYDVFAVTASGRIQKVHFIPPSKSI